MFRLAPLCGLYYGTDISGLILEKNQEIIDKHGYTNIVQKRLAANEIDKLDEREFDLVIINSVIQCFDGHNYLKNVINKAIGLMKTNGKLFLGDIMDQDKKKDLIKDLKEFKIYNKNYENNTKIDWDEELFLSRSFWNDLKLEISSIENVELSDKIYTIENELTKYRYDVLLSIDKIVKNSSKLNKKAKQQHDLKIIEK